MKFIKILIAVILLGVGAVHADVLNFANAVNDVIPDGNPTGLGSTIEISGVLGEIEDVNVNLEISGGYNGDLYAYLTGPNGAFAILLNRVGATAANAFGYDDAGFSITLDDDASIDIHTYGGNGGVALAGAWQPDGRDINPQLVLDSDVRNNLLSVFNTSSPNGTWTLFISDMAGGFESTIVSWGLRITTIPEPSDASLLVFGGIALTIFWQRTSSKRQRAR